MAKFVKWTGPALSPSRAKDFKSCPLKYKYAVIDKITFPPTIEAFKGTFTHQILEDMFKMEKSQRTLEIVKSLKTDVFDKVLESNPLYPNIKEVIQMQEDESYKQKFFNDVDKMIDNYFKLENPHRLNPSALEKWVQTFIDIDDEDSLIIDNDNNVVEASQKGKLRLGGFIDRLEVSPNAGVRISDYKTGKKPRKEYEVDAYFQMLFYALVYYKSQNELAKELKLIYLGDGDTLTKSPTEEELKDIEEQFREVWKNIAKCMRDNQWNAKISPLCPWCGFKDMCPSFEKKQNNSVEEKNENNS